MNNKANCQKVRKLLDAELQCTRKGIEKEDRIPGGSRFGKCGVMQRKYVTRYGKIKIQNYSDPNIADG